MISSITRLVLEYAIKSTIMNVQIIPFNVSFSTFVQENGKNVGLGAFQYFQMHSIVSIRQWLLTIYSEKKNSFWAVVVNGRVESSREISMGCACSISKNFFG